MVALYQILYGISSFTVLYGNKPNTGLWLKIAVAAESVAGAEQTRLLRFCR